MESVTCPTPPLADGVPKSPLDDAPISPRNSPTEEREKSSSVASHENAPSPEPNCAICLGKLQNKSFTDSCLHQFCFTCLLEWSKVKPECPLCKQSFKSIIHNVRSNEDYDQYHLRPVENPYPWVNLINLDMVQERFRYRSTLTVERRVERALQRLGRDLQRHVDAGDVIPPQRTLRRRRGLAPDEFRMSVYRQNLWVSSLPTIGMPRDTSPQNFRAHPDEVHRLIPWLNRELQAIMRNPGLSARVLDMIITNLPRHHIQSAEFHRLLENYLRADTDHFIHEFYTFARSSYDMIGFDENANYSVRPNFWVEEVHEVQDSSDSDVILLDESSPNDVPNPTPTALDLTCRRPLSPSSPVAGPSWAVLPVDQASDSEVNVSSPHSEGSFPTSLRDVISSLDNPEPRPSQSSEPYDSDSCLIVGYVKPRGERTPEIITINSSDPEPEEEEEGEVTEGPSVLFLDEVYGCNHNRNYKHYLYSSSSSSSSLSFPESSGSEYKPSQQTKKKRKTTKKMQHKKTSSKTTKSKTSRTGRHRSSSKVEYASSDSDSSSCTCSGKKSTQKRRKVRSSSSSSSVSSRISSSSSSDTDSESRSWRRDHKDKKNLWRVKVKMPGVKCEEDYQPPYTSSEIDSFLQGSVSRSRPKLRSIVITRAKNGRDEHRESSGSSNYNQVKSNRGKQREGSSSSKFHREDGVSKKVKEEGRAGSSAASGSRSHQRDGSHSSHSSRRHGESSSRHSSRSVSKDDRKQSRKDDKKKTKKRESDSSRGKKVRFSVPKKRKRILTFSDSSDN